MGNQEVSFAEEHIGLGFAFAKGRNGDAAFGHLEKQARSLVRQHVATFGKYDFSLSEAMLCLNTCTIPAAFHNAALLIFREDFDVRMNKLQEHMGYRLLALSRRIPRIVIFTELGWSLRLSTSTRITAARLYLRTRHDPRYLHTSEVLQVAADLPGTWTRSLLQWFHTEGSIALDSWQPPPGTGGDTDKLRNATRYYSTHALHKAAQAHDTRRWRRLQQQQSHLRRHGLRRWGLRVLMDAGIPLRIARLWAQLRIQGNTTTDNTIGCRLCGHAEGETAEHLLQNCQAVEKIRFRWFEEWPRMRQAQVTQWDKFILGEAPMRDLTAVISFLEKLSEALTSKPYSRQAHREQCATHSDTSPPSSCSSRGDEIT